jgi:isopentenyl diphosphate isomerase/L-lactate dehydrogenase-like FMN-dependent dehydrogenase
MEGVSMTDNYLSNGEKQLQERGFASRYGGPPGNSLKITRDYLDSLLIEIRAIDSVSASTEFRLFGEPFATPIMTAALSGLDGICPNAMAEMARGASAAGTAAWAGIGSEKELRDMTETGAKVVKIIKPYADHSLILEKLAQAEKYGAFAVGMDTDFVFGGKKKRGYAMDYPVGPKTLDDIRRFIGATRLPFVLKGILSERDAQKALDAGASGIVISHHGGSVLDYAVPPLMILPRIAKLIGGKIPIFVDCSIGSGADAFKALALGASAVSVGRAVMAGLAAEGAEGVRRVIEGMNEDLRSFMNLTGSKDIKNIDPDVLWR